MPVIPITPQFSGKFAEPPQEAFQGYKQFRIFAFNPNNNRFIERTVNLSDLTPTLYLFCFPFDLAYLPISLPHSELSVRDLLLISGMLPSEFNL